MSKWIEMACYNRLDQSKIFSIKIGRLVQFCPQFFKYTYYMPVALWISWAEIYFPYQKKAAGTKVLASQLSFGLSSKTQWLSGLYYADFISFYSPTQLCGGGTTKSNSNELPISVPLSLFFCILAWIRFQSWSRWQKNRIFLQLYNILKNFLKKPCFYAIID